MEQCLRRDLTLDKEKTHVREIQTTWTFGFKVSYSFGELAEMGPKRPAT